MEWGDKIPVGIFYRVEKPTFSDHLSWLADRPPLVDRVWEPRNAEKFMKELEYKLSETSDSVKKEIREALSKVK